MRISCKSGKKYAFLLAISMSALIGVQAQKKAVSPKDRAIELLKKNITASRLNLADLSNYLVTDAYQDARSGTFLVYLQQAHLGIPVYNKIGVYVFKSDTLVQQKTNYVSRIADVAGARTAMYSIKPEQAILFAGNHLSIPVKQTPQLLRKDDKTKRFVFTPSGLGLDSLISELVWLPMDNDKELRLSWNVRIASPDSRQDWFVRVDAQTGDYLEKNSLIVNETSSAECPDDNTAAFNPYWFSAPAAARSPLQTMAPPTVGSASYRVYPLAVESPNFGSRVLENNPWLKAGAGNNATTLGWHYDNTTNYNVTRGNNVWAQEDLDGSSSNSGLTDNSTTAIPSLTFDRALDFNMNPSTAPNMRAAIDNLFYWNNIMHDISYVYGFDEAAGNFQVSNMGRGGAENDYVNAFAEDGTGLNNANFATPPDGQNPRMRMYQWNVDVVSKLLINSPAGIAGDYTAVESSINLVNQLSYLGPKTGNIVLANDDAGGTTHQACTGIFNAASLAGNIALIDRGGGINGSCPFTLKIKTAQNAGAIAVIIANNVSTAPTRIGGSDMSIGIPAVMISQADGNTLKANLAGLNGTLSSSGIYKDGSLDNGIISHEYTHGISTRLTGGPSNASCLFNQEQMGEGWSDYMALMVTTNWATAAVTDGANSRTVGTYAASQAANGAGLRRYPYTTNIAVNPWTYGMMAGSTSGEVHNIGEIWCATIWDMTWNIIQQEGIDADLYHGTKGNNIALQLVIQGMKYQPCSPGFLDGRDAILKADSILYGYAHKCAIWNAFARRGMGKSASQGSSNSYLDQVAASDLPSGVGVTKTADKTALLNGDNIIYTIKAYCDCAAQSNISIVDTLSPKLTYVTSSGGTYTAPVVRFDNVAFAAGEVKTFTIQATVSGNYQAPVTLINDTRDPASYTWTAAAITGTNNWVETNARSHSPSHAWFASDVAGVRDFTLTSGDLALDSLAILSFWHYFETESSFDGGFVELSTDAGATWKDLGPYMTQNPYNNTMDPTSTGVVANRPSFSGSSGGSFIQTTISLASFAGTTVRIRFRFTSDIQDGGEGWYIDEIVLKNEKGVANRAYAYSGASSLSSSNTYALFTAVALPVHFNSFEAQKQNNTSFLHWQMSDELNVGKYIVERSTDGRTFNSIGELSPTQSGGNLKDYYFTDNSPLTGSNYYRIVEKDLDGKTTLSVTKLLLFDGSDMAVRLLPVPSYNHTVQLEIESNSRPSYNALLVNTVGQVLKTYTVRTGINQLDLQNFSKGIYYIKVELGAGHTVLKKLVLE